MLTVPLLHDYKTMFHGIPFEHKSLTADDKKAHGAKGYGCPIRV